jgi:hypothetical protein
MRSPNVTEKLPARYKHKQNTANHISHNVTESDTISLNVSAFKDSFCIKEIFVTRPNVWCDNNTLSYKVRRWVKFVKHLPTTVRTEADFKCWNLSGVILTNHRMPSVTG